MYQRCQRKKILSILLAHGPQNASLMRGWIPEHTECPLHQISEPALLTELAVCEECIYRHARRSSAQDRIDQLGTIAFGNGRFRAQFVGDTLGRLEYRVKIVVGHKLSPAEA